MPRVLVCAATRAEHDACWRGIASSRGSEHEEHEMLHTGVGPARAGRSLFARLARGARPDLVVSSGFAGALGSTLAISSWVTGIRVAEWNGVARVPVEGVALVEGPPGLVRCDVISTGALVSGPLVSSALVSKDPVVVDMESASLAREAAQRGVAFAVIRLVSDTPAHPLPAFLSPFTAALSATRTASRVALAGRGLRCAVASPREVLRLVKEGPTWLRRLEEGWREFARWRHL